jgi:Ca2+-binding EF-hand superfamily protein
MTEDGPVVRTKVRRIFAALDEDRDGALNQMELQQLAVRTGGSLSAGDYHKVCEMVGTSPDVGLREHELLQIYTRLNLGNIDEDFAKMGLELKAEPEPAATEEGVPPLANEASSGM